MKRKTVTVYFHGPEDARTFSFSPPKEVPNAAWQKHAFAVDDRGVLTLEFTGQYVLDDEGHLVKVVDWLTKILADAGYGAEFVPGIAPP
jgi:hypothetical protein